MDGFTGRFLRDCHLPPPAPLLGGAGIIGVDANQVGAIGGAGPLKRGFQLRNIGYFLGEGAERGRVGREIDVGRALSELQAVNEHVVEGLASATLLQTVDTSVAAIVEKHDD